MNEHRKDAPETAATHQEPGTAAKAPWSPPTMEEVDYSATEAAGAGGLYDGFIYNASI